MRGSLKFLMVALWLGGGLTQAPCFGDDSISGGNATPAPSGAPPAPLKSIPCLDASGNVANADPSQVCKATLPKCSDLLKTIETNVANDLALKIWGYYNGYDADLQKSSGSSTTNVNQTQNGTTSNTSMTFSATIGGGIPDVNKISWVGNKLPYPICSVIGHDTIGGVPTEITNQVIGPNASCGTKPQPRAGDNKQSVIMKFDATNGTQWSAFMLGIKPWLYRRAAYEIFRGTQNPGMTDLLGVARPALAPDLSNIGDVITSSPTAQADMQTTLSQLSSFYSGMGPATQALCSKTPQGLLDACKTGTVAGGQSVNTLCMLYSAQTMVQNAAYSNLILAEIFARANQIYFAKYAHILDKGNADFQKWIQDCTRRGSSRNIGEACSASCILTGTYTAGGSQVTDNGVSHYVLGNAYGVNVANINSGKDYGLMVAVAAAFWVLTSITAGADLLIIAALEALASQTNLRCESPSLLDLRTDDFGAQKHGGTPDGALTSFWGYITDGFTDWPTDDTLKDLGNSDNPWNSYTQPGFAGFIEKIIRRQVCGQSDKSVAAPYCSVNPLKADGSSGDPWGVASVPTASTPTPTPAPPTPILDK